MAYKKETVELDGEKIRIKKGALHRSLGVPDSYTFTLPVINKLLKVDNGKQFTFKGKKKKMTALTKRRLGLAKALMGGRKKKGKGRKKKK